MMVSMKNEATMAKIGPVRGRRENGVWTVSLTVDGIATTGSHKKITEAFCMAIAAFAAFGK
jgi:hypothetical protein